MTPVQQLAELFAGQGAAKYLGEPVTIGVHMRQAGALAQTAGAAPELVAAALLHDVGHMLSGLSQDVAERGINDVHERNGADWLEKHFGPAVVMPVRLHVAAERYLCAVEPEYLRGLSPASQLSLGLHGGPVAPAEVRSFEAQPHAKAAVALRRWDDGAKVPGWQVPDLETYRTVLATALRRGGNST